MGSSMSKAESFSVLSVTETDTSDASSSSNVYFDEERDEPPTLCSSQPLFFFWNKREAPLLTFWNHKNSISSTTTQQQQQQDAAGRSLYSARPSFCSTKSTLFLDDDDEDDDPLDSSSRHNHHSLSPSDSSSALEGTGCMMTLSPSFSSLDASSDWFYTQEELDMVDGDEPTVESDLRPSPERVRRFWVVTTAALPWMTGTAVNPLLRAAHLCRMNRAYVSDPKEEEEEESNNSTNTVTLVVPWLESPEDRVDAYGADWRHKTRQDQDAHMRAWLADTAGLPQEASDLQIQFYNARWHRTMNSIFAMGDICAAIPNDQADVCILEEPEHLNVYRAPGKDWWTEKFTHVVGIGHTNYRAYVREHLVVMAPVVSTLLGWMVRAYCHKVIKLSSVLQTYAPEKEVVCNVHGVRQDFLEIGRRQEMRRSGIYYIGKLLWAKGLDRLIDLQLHFKKLTGSYFELDIVGSGPEEEEIRRAFLGQQSRRQRHADMQPTESSSSSSYWNPPNNSNGNSKTTSTTSSSLRLFRSRYELRKDAIPASFCGRQDHSNCQKYKIFVNPSVTEVLCTTTMEALAMNKFVLVPSHPSNLFFRQFPNCLQFSSKTEFVTLLQYAQTHDPEPLSEELRHELTWEAATERCLDAASISRRDARRRERVGKTKLDHNIAKLHYEIGKGYKGDVLRKVLGGGPVSDQVRYEERAMMAAA